MDNWLQATTTTAIFVFLGTVLRTGSRRSAIPDAHIYGECEMKVSRNTMYAIFFGDTSSQATLLPASCAWSSEGLAKAMPYVRNGGYITSRSCSVWKSCKLWMTFQQRLTSSFEHAKTTTTADEHRFRVEGTTLPHSLSSSYLYSGGFVSRVEEMLGNCTLLQKWWCRWSNETASLL